MDFIFNLVYFVWVIINKHAVLPVTRVKRKQITLHYIENYYYIQIESTWLSYIYFIRKFPAEH